MSNQYVKLVSRKQIIFPPHTNGNTTNYHLCESMLIADGYKPLDDSQTPPQNGTYTPYYEETADKIVRKWENRRFRSRLITKSAPLPIHQLLNILMPWLKSIPEMKR